MSELEPSSRSLTLIFLLAFACQSCAGLVAETTPPSPRPIRANAVCRSEPSPSSKRTQSSTPKGRAPSTIQGAMRSNYVEIQACYCDALWRKPDASGRVQLRFVIDEAGRVADSCVQEPVFADGDAVDCILARLNEMKFGLGGRVTIVYPIDLVPAQEHAFS